MHIEKAKFYQLALTRLLEGKNVLVIGHVQDGRLPSIERIQIFEGIETYNPTQHKVEAHCSIKTSKGIYTSLHDLWIIRGAIWHVCAATYVDGYGGQGVAKRWILIPMENTPQLSESLHRQWVQAYHMQP